MGIYTVVLVLQRINWVFDICGVGQRINQVFHTFQLLLSAFCCLHACSIEGGVRWEESEKAEELVPSGVLLFCFPHYRCILDWVLKFAV